MKNILRNTACLLITFAAAIAGQSAAGPAFATTGPGCLRVVNIGPGDVLNIRQRPSASSRVVGAIDPANQGILSLSGVCKPLSVTWGSRWCPVRYFTGGPNDPVRGFVKARFVRDNDCP